MTLAHPDRFTTLDQVGATPLRRVTVICREAQRGTDRIQAAYDAAQLAGWARHQRMGSVYVCNHQNDALGLSARIERLAQTVPDAIVVPDSGGSLAATRELLSAIARELPNSLLILAREEGLQGNPLEDLGHYHFLLTGDTGPGLAKLLAHIEGKREGTPRISGLTWRDAQGVLHAHPAWHSGSDLPEGPPPAWELLGPRGEVPYAIRTARVCAPDCPTCHGAFGRTLRRAQLEAVWTEARRLQDELGARRIAILDRVFDFEPTRAKALLRGLIGIRADFEWSLPHGLRGDRIDSELAHLLRRAGLRTVELPIGSASPRIQQALGSNLDLAGLERGIQHLADEGVRVVGVFGLGYDREDPRERERSVAFARRSALHSVRFEPVGARRHGNRWSDRVRAGWAFYTGSERQKAWKRWLSDRGETTWQPALEHWMHEVGCRLRLRQRQS